MNLWRICCHSCGEALAFSPHEVPELPPQYCYLCILSMAELAQTLNANFPDKHSVYRASKNANGEERPHINRRSAFLREHAKWQD